MRINIYYGGRGNLDDPTLFALKKIEKVLIDDFKVEVRIENRESLIYIDGKLANEEELQSKASSLAVSVVGGIADNTKLFEYARNLIDELKVNHNVIVSGRSIMKIYPDVDYHLFITASLEERVKRKCIQYNENENKNSVRKNIILRDILQRIAGFYKIHKNTIKIDVTDCKSVEESTSKVLEYIKTGDGIYALYK